MLGRILFAVWVTVVLIVGIAAIHFHRHTTVGGILLIFVTLVFSTVACRRLFK